MKKLFNKNKLPASSDMPQVELDEEEAPRRKSGASGFVSVIAIALIIVLLLTSMPSGPRENSTVQQKVIKGSPVVNTISSVITGAGTLEPGSTETVRLPEAIELKKYYVHNGDKVASGDVLAAVDQVQVLAAIGELAAVMQTLDTDLNNASNAVESGRITAQVPGRVKAIFAQPGGDVAQTVYDNGCLMLLSLDGMMYVTFQAEAEAALGDVVDVTMRDGTVETGKVYGVADGKITVTLSDYKAPYHESVIVTTSDGTMLGSGELEIHSPLEISGYYGTVSQISAKLDQKVSSGANLITLKDTGHTAKYTSLLKRRNELSEQMDILISMSDGFVRATEAGIVTDIPADSEYATEEEKAEIVPTAFMDEFTNVHLDWLTGSGDAKFVRLGEGDEIGSLKLKAKIVSVDAAKAVLDFGEVENFPSNLTNPLEVPITTQIINVSGMGDPVIIFLPQMVGQSVDVVLTTVKDSSGNVTGSINTIMFGGSGLPSFDISGLLAGMMGRFSFGSGTTQQKSYEAYSTDTVDILGLIPMDELTVTIQVDELDILRLHKGMDTEITMDAFQGTTFPGTITRVGNIGQNSGGNTKYAVEVTLNTTEQMLVGMNASVSIVTDTTAPVLTVPAAALQEESGKTWIYTEYDSKKDTLGGLTQVTTGISDGDIVEIKSGLDENSVYYYRYADSITYNFMH